MGGERTEHKQGEAVEQDFVLGSAIMSKQGPVFEQCSGNTGCDVCLFGLIQNKKSYTTIFFLLC